MDVKLEYYKADDILDDIFIKMPKVLFTEKYKELSLNAKNLYSLLLDRVSLSIQNNWCDDKGDIYIVYTLQQAQDMLGFSKGTICRLFKELESYKGGLIKKAKQGQGKADLIYVKNISSYESDDGYKLKYEKLNGSKKVNAKDKKIFELDQELNQAKKQIEILENQIQKTIVEEFINKQEKVDIDVLQNSCNCIQNETPRSSIIENLEFQKLSPINTNLNKNNLINNNSFILSKNEEVRERMNEKNKTSKLDLIAEMYDKKELPYNFTASENKMNVAIKELVDYDLTLSNYKNKTVDEFYFSTYKLFTNALISMLTHKGNMTLNSQNITYSKVYDKLTEYISFEEDEFCNTYCHLNNLVDNAISDYKKGSLQTEIKYPKKYMQSCIWNAMQIGDIRMLSDVNAMMNDVELVNSAIDKAKNKSKKQDFTKETSFNLQEVQDMWNNHVPRLI